jgi:hypothetical protein
LTCTKIRNCVIKTFRNVFNHLNFKEGFGIF